MWLRNMPRLQTSNDVFRAIADPTRRAILDRLRAGPANAGALAADFRSSRPAVSKHLRVLREARLVVDTRVGRERVYTVDPMPLQSVAGWLEGYRAF
jgi:DNA-binding transcriptional ArsR family regulator